MGRLQSLCPEVSPGRVRAYRAPPLAGVLVLSLTHHLLSRSFQQFNQVTFRAHSSRLCGISCCFSAGNKKKGYRPYDAYCRTCKDIEWEDSK